MATDHAVAQGVGHGLPMVTDCIKSHVGLCGICGGESGMGLDSSASPHPANGFTSINHDVAEGIESRYSVIK
jgi:hypothetical protein